ncbi:MAG TPA: glycosyltransferase family 4 protein [Acidobacteriota bacterium]|jgi:glycosyltransferase involved in cell wall biosynthesis
MKILILCDVLFPQTTGGAGRVARELALAIRDRGTEVRFLTRRVPDKAADEGIPTTYLPKPGTSFPSQFRRAFRRTAADFKPDIIHVHQPLPAWLSIPPESSCPIVYTFHSSWPEELKVKASPWPAAVRRLCSVVLANIEASVIHRAAAVTVLSEFSSREVKRLYRREAEVIPGGVDTGHFRPSGVPPAGSIKLITLRNLVPRMGLRQLVRAMPLLPAEVHLDIGGEGPLRGELRALIQSLKLDTRVRLRGHIPDSELPGFYSSGHWFVLPTAALEGFGLVILESLACGTPVLGTRVGAIPELLQRFNSAWLIERSTPDAIAGTIRSALDQPGPEREELHRRIEAEFGWKIIAAQYQRLFDGLL